jgi:hypothetical protein
MALIGTHTTRKGWAQTSANAAFNAPTASIAAGVWLDE